MFHTQPAIGPEVGRIRVRVILPTGPEELIHAAAVPLHPHADGPAAGIGTIGPQGQMVILAIHHQRGHRDRPGQDIARLQIIIPSPAIDPGHRVIRHNNVMAIPGLRCTAHINAHRAV